jgi:hypothetical protein
MHLVGFIIRERLIETYSNYKEAEVIPSSTSIDKL